jgi:xanthine dehydrogenase accessory factor
MNSSIFRAYAPMGESDMSVNKTVDTKELKIVIRGAGEMASGIAHNLYSAGFRKILMTEIAKPLSVRRTVSFSEAVNEGEASVEGVRGVLIDTVDELPAIWEEKMIAIIVDPAGNCIKKFRPDVLIDARMLKKQTSLTGNEAPFVIGIGPGFTAPANVHAVIESNRGNNLGRVIWDGSAEPFTGTPGSTRGFTTERVLRSPKVGTVLHVKHIGEIVTKGDTILYVDEIPVCASIDGVLRGLIREISVEKNEKVGDIDPRGHVALCYSISDKARAIGNGVLEAIMRRYG